VYFYGGEYLAPLH